MNTSLHSEGTRCDTVGVGGGWHVKVCVCGEVNAR